MIYLIDDKKKRQNNDFGWTEEKLDNYNKSIQAIYTLDKLTDLSEEIFTEGNTVIYHESFLDNTSLSLEAVLKRDKLYEFSEKNQNFHLVIFSGSKSSRTLEKNVAHVPVSIVYQNLDVYAKEYLEGNKDLNYLMFGKNPNIEKEIEEKLDTAIDNLLDSKPAKISNKRNLFLRPKKRYIQNSIENVEEKTLYNDVTDEKFSLYIKEWLSEKKFDNIFIPLCFGETLSDYNGLRLATHIRCTETPNRLSNIFIYGLVGVEYLFDNKYFNILRTKNIRLIGFNKRVFEAAGNEQIESLKSVELSKEISKLKLEPPKNYEDNHSIANEWAIYRWANAIGTLDKDIEKIVQRVKSQLYYKYLTTIYPIKDITKITESELKLEFSGSKNLLYIDDEAEKGWSEILCTVIEDFNGINFRHIDDEFKLKSQDQIVEIAINKVKNSDADIVLLDYRLHPDDFKATNAQEITGLKVLTEIKNLNPAIQVIIFSATNKIWNLKALQKKGADGFIIKELPENSANSLFTSNAIYNLIDTLNQSLKKGFLKSFYNNYLDIRRELIPRKNFKKADKPLPKDFVDETLYWFKLSFDILVKNELNDSNIVGSFILMFSVLENIANRVIDVENPYEINDGFFQYEFRGSNRKLKYFKEDESNMGYYRKTKSIMKSKKHIPWSLKILNTIDFISNEQLAEKDLSEIIKKRNEIIHANTTGGSVINIGIDNLIFLHDIIYKGLKNIL